MRFTQMANTIEIKQCDYENVVAKCTNCNKENIYNRTSDLGTTIPIAHKKVVCEHCHHEFGINGDLVNERYEMLIFDCYYLFQNKKYMQCMTQVCQACEMFFQTS